MGKYRVEVGSFVTRMITRHIIVSAKNEDEAREKAIKKYEQIEMALPSSSDTGSPQVDSVIEVN